MREFKILFFVHHQNTAEIIKENQYFEQFSVEH